MQNGAIIWPVLYGNKSAIKVVKWTYWGTNHPQYALSYTSICLSWYVLHTLILLWAFKKEKANKSQQWRSIGIKYSHTLSIALIYPMRTLFEWIKYQEPLELRLQRHCGPFWHGHDNHCQWWKCWRWSARICHIRSLSWLKQATDSLFSIIRYWFHCWNFIQ